MLLGNALTNATNGINRLEGLHNRRTQLERISTEAAASGRPAPGIIAEIASVSSAIASTITGISTAKEDAKQAIQINDNFAKIGEAVAPR
ncbi:MAG: hypothetical protein A3I68_09105 [Candidatus Melainabacteria bacterium RIFCSPLOWO2_02_FULL_35_15]|nr:MAG: hypothetical protein A3F80_03290 [Candidatus Melainabacteria bacterium RIFCSPLOWO2_12_FULL_35_11]OGI13677.1 MAG: hypothetical protein A3I68_09105 [Candidatus Melainabacteria bacterium RIFCSPLOWO2_02_FULL_35_15]